MIFDKMILYQKVDRRWRTNENEKYHSRCICIFLYQEEFSCPTFLSIL